VPTGSLQHHVGKLNLAAQSDILWMSAVIFATPRRALPFAGVVIETGGGVLSTVMDTDAAAVLFDTNSIV